MRSNSSPKEASESLIWTFDGKLRMTAALAALLVPHLLATVMVVHFLARSDTVAMTGRGALGAIRPDTLPVAQIAKAHD
jgi:hypothetical protein